MLIPRPLRARRALHILLNKGAGFERIGGDEVFVELVVGEDQWWRSKPQSRQLKGSQRRRRKTSTDLTQYRSTPKVLLKR